MPIRLAATRCPGNEIEKGDQRAPITPLLVATIQRPPWRAIDWTRPTPGTRSPRDTRITPRGPCKIALPPTTSRTTQLGMLLASLTPCEADFGGSPDPFVDLAAGVALVGGAAGGAGLSATAAACSPRPRRSLTWSS